MKVLCGSGLGRRCLLLPVWLTVVGHGWWWLRPQRPQRESVDRRCVERWKARGQEDALENGGAVLQFIERREQIRTIQEAQVYLTSGII